MSGDVATLARRFAHALEQLRGTWDQQYVSARPLPPPSADWGGADRDDVTEGEREPEATRTVSSPEPVAAAPRSASAPPSSPASSVVAANASAPPSSPASPEVATRASAPPSSPVSPDVATRASAPPSSLASSVVARYDEPAASSSARDAAEPRAAAAPGPAPDVPVPALREPAAKARREALREQAQHWSASTKLEYLRRHNVGDCQRCPLSRTRNHIVFGVGNPEADLMFVGEAPGADEDRQGEPFVGRAGQLLNQWLHELSLSRDDVYIANVLKCRPPGNRDPRPEEVDRCSPFLQAQIRAIEPKVIVALGRHAGMLLSRREDMTLRAMRGGRLFYDAGTRKDDPSVRIQIPLVVTYHPAYVLRQEGDGRAPPSGRASPTEMVMTDLRRALTFVRGA